MVGRYHDQRAREQSHRGASKGCIERNTFPHKFKKIPREKSGGDGEEDEDEGDKCTICLCGEYYASSYIKKPKLNLTYELSV